MSILAFQITQILIIALFAAYVLVVRKRDDEAPLLHTSLPIFMVSLYGLFLVAFTYVLLVHLEGVTVYDWITLFLTALGTLVIIRARRDLGAGHTSVGFVKRSPEFVHEGVYSILRHPFYTGVYLFTIGSLFTVVVHAGLALGIAMALPGAALLAFVTVLAEQEERALYRTFGEQYVRYRISVRAFLPISFGNIEGDDVFGSRDVGHPNSENDEFRS